MKPADRAWLALAAGVIAWDVLGPEMLSEASSRYIQAHPWIWHVTVTYVACHVMHLLPARLDLLATLGRLTDR